MNNKANKTLDCDIVSDLLELYHDGVVRPTTAKVVSEHLTICEKCKKEYERLKETLPEAAEHSTRKEFSKLMKKEKIKQIFTTVICCLLACLILASSYYLLTEAHLKVSDVEVHQVYKYTAPDNNDYFFVLYSYDTNSSSSPKIEVKHDFTEGPYQERHTIVFDRMVPIISRDKQGAPYVDHVFFRADEISTKKQGIISGLNCDELIFCGDIIWTKETNSDDEVPGYVAAYYDFENGNQDEFSNSDEISYSVKVDPDNINSPDNYISVSYPNKTVYWNLKGEVIKEVLREPHTSQTPEAE